MKKHHPYNNIVERKLEQLPIADADQLWNDMHVILDKKMPQKKERRRFVMWFFAGSGLSLLTIAILNFTGSSLFISPEKESIANTNEKQQSPSKTDKLIDDAAKVSVNDKKNATIANEKNQKAGDNVTGIESFSNTVDYAVNNAFTKRQTKMLSVKNITKEQFSQEPIQNNTGAKPGFHISTVDLQSIHKDVLIGTIHNKFLNQQKEPVAYKKKTNPKNDNDHNINNFEKGWYAGVMGGIDMSSIHLKNVRTGSTAGFIIGYSLNKKWSIESGLYWDTKRVYDDGKYFNPPGYTPTNGITITAVNGKSRIYELPVNIKYTIIPGKRSLFATAGVSSYFMRSENYDYEYEQNNQPGGHNYLTYKNVTKDLFSVGSISVGYSHHVGKSGSIRVEPYLKLPLKNIGVGNMPIMSTGLNVGFVKKLR